MEFACLRFLYWVYKYIELFIKILHYSILFLKYEVRIVFSYG